MIIKTNAIVLRSIPYSDTSVICKLFTENKGKVTILAKGALNSKKFVSALLEPVNHIHLQYYHRENREIQLFKEAIFVNNYPILRQCLNSIPLFTKVSSNVVRSTEFAFQSYEIVGRA